MSLTSAPGVTLRAGQDVVMLASPIRSEWVIEGTPEARTHAWGPSRDRSVSHWTWDCTAGRFRWYHDQDETIVVVAGSAVIGIEGTSPTELGPGDAAYFPAGSWTRWHVPDYVRKQAVLRIPVPSSMAYLSRGLGLRRHRLREDRVR